MDRIWLLLQFSFATRTNNLDLHIFCLQKLCPLLFSLNHQNYAKYLSVYYIMLINLPQQSKDLLQANRFSVSRSDTPASRTAADMTIEQTINKHAKTSGGIVRLAEANQHITHGVSQGITELNTSQQHIRWPTSN
ncbi:hypothetical protein PoB_003288600 [Plakobranchus ocellatus]|uniref:Uncharacterized protein n=1 Tax=Plakobranchus ocellatus TaxID=259542 RepID=A0AAV4ADD1_9GAST|nr:hypothetical protein PoB_003288600 [Plakobranchus ocellatus]